MSLIINGVNFGSSIISSGALGFYGEGYPFHKAARLLPGFNLSGATLTTKTVTIKERMSPGEPDGGNLKLNPDTWLPEELFPDCIRVYLKKGMILNSVGLSNPGLLRVLYSGVWQSITKPFIISFMCVGKTKEERIEEAREFATWMSDPLWDFKTKFIVEVNFTCPNAGHALKELSKEMPEIMKEITRHGLVAGAKVNVLIPPSSLDRLITYGHCSFISVSDTIPWGELFDNEEWRRLFGTNVSPLAHLGGGGLSSRIILPHLYHWIKEYKKLYPKTPVIAGGGIQHRNDLFDLSYLGVEAIGIASVLILRPHRVQSIIKTANWLFKSKVR